jgi:hypothetical protein
MMDYTKFTKAKTPEAVEPKEIQNGVEEIIVEKPVTVGVVVDCKRLNLRALPEVDAEIIGTIDVDSEVTIEDSDFDDFYKVCTAAGAEGFCMKDYILIKQ